MGSSQIPLRFLIRPGWVASRVLRLSFASVNRVGNCQFRQFPSKLVLGNEEVRFDSGGRFGLKEAEPAALAPKDVDERALEGGEAGAEIAFPLLGSESGGGFEEALAGPAVVVGLGLNLVGVHIPREM